MLAASRYAGAQCYTPEYDEIAHSGAVLPVLADLNGDGILDLVNGSTVLLGRGDGTFADGVLIVTGRTDGGNPFVFDVNGDFKPDVVVGVGDAVDGCAGGTAGGAYPSSPGGFVPGLEFWGAGQNLVADWNHDGILDLVGGAGMVIGVRSS